MISQHSTPNSQLPNDIARLHRVFCELTKRAEPVRFYERTWGVILQQPEYAYDAAAVERDMRLIVAYLLAAIGEAKRNLGALKLRNFLAPDTWFADLEEAKARAKTRKAAWEPKPPDAAPAKRAADDDQWEKSAEVFADLKRQISGGPQQ